jgi:DNA-binding NarL/FixJ family response regulator
LFLVAVFCTSQAFYVVTCVFQGKEVERDKGAGRSYFAHEVVGGSASFMIGLSDNGAGTLMTGVEEEGLGCVARLLEAGELQCNDIHEAAERLGQVVVLTTRGRAQLLLYPPIISADANVQAKLSSSSYPVCCNDRHYGMVQVNAALNHTTTGGALSPLVAHVVAQVCGLLLYSFEMSALMQAEREQLIDADASARKPLTTREQTILRMMGGKCSNREIADTLQIEMTTVRKHQQGIYRKLGAKNKHEALLASYDGGI